MKIRRVIPDLHGDAAASRSFYEDVMGTELGMDMGWMVTFGDEPWQVRRFFVRVPNGAVIYVMQHLE